MNIYILIGIPGCGKSTYINKHKWKNDIVLSSDEIRNELFGDENIQINNALVFETLFHRLKEATKNKSENIYIDATNIAKKERRILLNTIKRYNKTKTQYIDGVLYKSRDYKITWVNIEVDLDTLIKRDLNRERTVGEKVIMKMLKRYTCPHMDEWFDEIIMIDNTSTNLSNDFKNELLIFVETWDNLEKLLASNHWLQASLDCEQTSKYHQESLLEHLNMILEWVEKNATVEDIKLYRLLTIFHDIWKPYAKDTKKNHLIKRGYKHIEDNTFEKKNWDLCEVEWINDFQFLGHESLWANMFRISFKPYLIENDIVSKNDADLLEIVIAGHLEFHKNQNDSIKITSKIYENNTKVFKIGSEFSEYDSKWRIWKNNN